MYLRTKHPWARRNLRLNQNLNREPWFATTDILNTVEFRVNPVFSTLRDRPCQPVPCPTVQVVDAVICRLGRQGRMGDPPAILSPSPRLEFSYNLCAAKSSRRRLNPAKDCAQLRLVVRPRACETNRSRNRRRCRAPPAKAGPRANPNLRLVPRRNALLARQASAGFRGMEVPRQSA